MPNVKVLQNERQKMFKDRKIEKYLRKLRHPEIEYYGLNCDAQLWADFNKELRLREIMNEERAILNHMMLLLGKPENCNFKETFNDAERLYGVAKLSLLIEQDKVNRFTYEVINEKN